MEHGARRHSLRSCPARSPIGSTQLNAIRIASRNLPLRRRTCWAQGLGGCRDGLSGEHLVSENLWSGDSIYVVGFEWCKTTPKKIGLSSLTANILCRGHNSDLSPVDTAGGTAFKSLRRSEELTEARRHIPHVPWVARWFGTNGPLLERWFLKTAINLLMVQHPDGQWLYPNSPGEPPIEFARIAFGLAEFEKPLGLYCAAKVGDQIEAVDGILFAPLWSEGRIAGAAFTFLGHKFFLNLAPERIAGVNASGIQFQSDDLLYHLARINNDVGGRRSHYFDFEWPGSHLNHFAP